VYRFWVGESGMGVMCEPSYRHEVGRGAVFLYLFPGAVFPTFILGTVYSLHFSWAIVQSGMSRGLHQHQSPSQHAGGDAFGIRRLKFPKPSSGGGFLLEYIQKSCLERAPV
jgi:hypothetical protein